MKKIIWTVATIIFLFIVVKVFVFYLSTAECPTPEKPNNVPESATWKGNCDGGSWLELVSLTQKKIRLRIYQDWNGSLLIDADFNYHDCANFHLNENNWKDCLGDFINGNINVNIKCMNNIKCRLEPIYPVYYEDKI